MEAKFIGINIVSNFQGQMVSLHPSIIIQNQEVILVDCGYEGSLQSLSERLAIHHLKITDLTSVIISHDDIDHLGGLYELKQAHPFLQVCASSIEAPYIAGQLKSLRLQQAEDLMGSIPDEHRAWALSFQETLKSIKRLPVNRILNQKIGEDIQIIPTPGHTIGHISIYLPSTKTLIANDALVIEGGHLNLANPHFALNLQEAILSVSKLSNLEINTLYCYHGGILKGNISTALKMLVKRYQSDS